MIQAHFAKYRKLVAALALLNHVTEPGAYGPISESAVKPVLEFIEYLISHANRIYTSGRFDMTATAKVILKKIYHRYLPDPFTVRDVIRHHWTGNYILDVETAMV